MNPGLIFLAKLFADPNHLQRNNCSFWQAAGKSHAAAFAAMRAENSWPRWCRWASKIDGFHILIFLHPSTSELEQLHHITSYKCPGNEETPRSLKYDIEPHFQRDRSEIEKHE